MNNREKRRLIAQDTLKILEQGYFKTPQGETINIKTQQAFAEENTILYTPELSDELLKNHQVVV